MNSSVLRFHIFIDGILCFNLYFTGQNDLNVLRDRQRTLQQTADSFISKRSVHLMEIFSSHRFFGTETRSEFFYGNQSTLNHFRAFRDTFSAKWTMAWPKWASNVSLLSRVRFFITFFRCFFARTVFSCYHHHPLLRLFPICLLFPPVNRSKENTHFSYEFFRIPFCRCPNVSVAFTWFLFVTPNIRFRKFSTGFVIVALKQSPIPSRTDK